MLIKANVSDTKASYLDLHLTISDGYVKTKIFLKEMALIFDSEFPISRCSTSFDIQWCLYFSTYSFCSSV